MPRADVLDRSDRVEQMRPAFAIEHDAVRRARAARRDRGQHQRLSANGGEPAGVAVDMGQLWSTNVVMMEDSVRLARDDAQPVPAQEELGHLAAIRKETGRSGLDRGDAQRPDLRQDTLGFELFPPFRNVAHAPR